MLTEEERLAASHGECLAIATRHMELATAAGALLAVVEHQKAALEALQLHMTLLHAYFTPAAGADQVTQALAVMTKAETTPNGSANGQVLGSI